VRGGEGEEYRKESQLNRSTLANLGRSVYMYDRQQSQLNYTFEERTNIGIAFATQITPSEYSYVLRHPSQRRCEVIHYTFSH
jgi:hypothetical protein